MVPPALRAIGPPVDIKFAQALNKPAFEAREAVAGKDARTLAAEVLAMDDEQFRTAFKKSPIKRAKRSGLARNAAVTLSNITPHRLDR